MIAWLGYGIGLLSYAVLIGGMGYWTFRFLAPALDPFVHAPRSRAALSWLFIKVVTWFFLLSVLGVVVGEWTFAGHESEGLEGK